MHGGENLALVLLLFFGSAKILAEVFGRLRMPPIVGEIVAGVLIGPGVLGWVHPNQLLDTLSELGVMFLLFRVGLEVKPSQLMRVGGVAALVAVLGVIVPFAAGWAILIAAGEPQIEAIFIGASMVATSIGISAQVLATQGLLSRRASQVILAAAVIDDVLGFIVLAIVSGMAKAQVNVTELALTAALAIGFTFIVARWGTVAAGKLIDRVGSRMREGEVEFNLSMILLFALAVLASYAGVAAIIGAFLAGMALAGVVSPRAHDLTHGVSELLTPFFLAGIGLNMDLAALGNPEVMKLAGLVLLAAILSKLIACGAGAWSLGWRDMFRVGAGMVPRGEVGMVVAQLGLSLGVISKALYGVVVLMSVMTTIVAPPLLSLAFREPRGRSKESAP
jgi:Kef-type K+ transport system membrane component KefB